MALFSKHAIVPVKLSARQAEGQTMTAQRARALLARYDAAQTTDDNRRYWAGADGLSADALNTPPVRAILRFRSRYEVANNSYAKGIVVTLANDLVGTGPRLQVLTDDLPLNTATEKAFAKWAVAVNLAEKLRTVKMARVVDGEAFAVLFTNPAVPHPVKLDIRLVEADCVTTPYADLGDPKVIDGIRFDEFWNPVEYAVLRRHPGATAGPYGPFPGTWDTIPAANMIHLFRPDRPGQHRGIPELTPALELFGQLRRYTLAVLAAAETAADFAAVLYTDAPADGEATPVDPMDTVELEKRMATTLPQGWKLGQIEAQQPATTYGDFKHEILNEIARCLNLPYNIAAGNSSSYNYSSGRLDGQVYFKAVGVEQSTLEAVAIDRLFGHWMAEAVRLPEMNLAGLAALGGDPPHSWFWDGFEHVDPAKEASAQETRLKNGTTTLAYEYAREGKDWEAEVRQRGKEIVLCKQLGVPVPQAGPAAKPAPAAADSNQDAANNSGEGN